MTSVGIVRELWRYPVKSMAGERLSRARVTTMGFVGDRLWAVRDEREGVITSAKKLPKLMLCSARFVAEPELDAGPGSVPHVSITLPDGRELRSDDHGTDEALSGYVGKPVKLCALRPASDRAHYRARNTRAGMREIFGLRPDEPLPDLSMLPLSLLAELGQYATPRGTYFDAYTLHLVTTATLDALRSCNTNADFDARRFRPNMVIETPASGDSGFVERNWCGGALSAGTVVAAIDAPTVRCSMPSRAQPDLPADPAVMKTVAADADRCVGVYANVREPGSVAAGDEVTVVSRPASRLGLFARHRATDVKRLILRAAAAAMPKK